LDAKPELGGSHYRTDLLISQREGALILRMRAQFITIELQLIGTIPEFQIE